MKGLRHQYRTLGAPLGALAILVATLALTVSPAKLALAQDESDDTTTEDGQLVPDYLDEDLFIDVEEGTGELDPDFFDMLEISPDGLPGDDAGNLEGIDVDGLPSLPTVPERSEYDYATYWDTAVFRALDKVTARIRIVEAPLNQAVTYERFEILVRQCNKRPPEEAPNTTAFVEILEIDLGAQDEVIEQNGSDAQSKMIMEIGLEEQANQTRPANSVFSGWMFASSPGLSAVEHPVYDVWLIDCKRVAPDIIEPSEENEILIESAE